MRSFTKVHTNHCDPCKKETLCPKIIRSGYSGLTVIPAGTILGTTFTVNSLTIDNSSLDNSCIKISFSSNILSEDFEGTLVFQFYKYGREKNIKIPVGPQWTFSVKASEAKAVSFSVYDCDLADNSYYTYVVTAKVAY
ncbi:DUF4489 domain-containing protein [Clostridium oryzae]|uniref:Uncharacterized protein n=1 Tax=Clostridium oryzae TaxID=1450648 RepID=A0A1V4IEP5_9CLOT|nr:DUF4489 domain-containing protein [Clostridium oryzae]OPJ58451.1 hypothetical protein CLORY_36010 [Clostridium oryzae]